MPPHLVRLDFMLTAAVHSVSQAKQIYLGPCQGFALANTIDRYDKIEDLHLTRTDGRYVLDVLGRTGEPEPQRGVKLTLTHLAFTSDVIVSLKTDDAGRLDLGELAGIERLRAQTANSPPRQWRLEEDRHTYPSAFHQAAGQSLRVPYMGRSQKATPEEFALVEMRGGTIVADRLDAVTIEKGFLVIQPLPPGDYALHIKPADAKVAIRASGGPAELGFAMGSARQLELAEKPPLQIVAVAADKDSLRIQLANASPAARVHVQASRYVLEQSFYRQLAPRPVGLDTYAVALPESVYLSGRDIGDEYRYILDRRYARKFPGNMLQRPGLLLNPFSVDAARNENAGRGGGARYGICSGGSGHGPSCSFAGSGGHGNDMLFLSNFNFLPEPAVLLANLAPDKDGVVLVETRGPGR